MSSYWCIFIIWDSFKILLFSLFDNDSYIKIMKWLIVEYIFHVSFVLQLLFHNDIIIKLMKMYIHLSIIIKLMKHLFLWVHVSYILIVSNSCKLFIVNLFRNDISIKIIKMFYCWLYFLVFMYYKFYFKMVLSLC